MVSLEPMLICAAPEPEEDYKPPHIRVPGRILVEIHHVYPKRVPYSAEQYSTYQYELEVHDSDGETGVFWITEGVGWDYWFDQYLDVELPGFYVLEGVCGYWTRGDGWTTDDDEDWEFALCRRATPEEIETLTLEDIA